MAEEMLVLPSVAKNVFVLCKKCDAERFHKVLAHTSPKSAKLECEVCKGKRTLTLSTGKKKAVPGAPKTARGIAAAARAENSRKNAHSAEYQQLLEAGKMSSPASYSMTAAFKEGQAVKHSKFGLGLVRTVTPQKIEVMFAEELKSLIHNRHD